jgi:hypothetical protein
MLRFDCVLATLFPPQSRESGFNHSRVRIKDNGEQRGNPSQVPKTSASLNAFLPQEGQC